jgi:biotin carboxylase
MSRPVVIVNPLSSAIELAPAFNARGIPVIAVTFEPKNESGFGMKIHTSDFINIIPNQNNLEEILRKYDPIAIIPGTDEATSLTDKLTLALTPQFANDPKKTTHRSHKALMQQALLEAGVDSLKTLNTASEVDVEAWLKLNNLTDSPLIIKPPMSAGSDKVFHTSAKRDWKTAFNRVLTEPSIITGKISETVVIQEEAIGTEFAVGTVSVNGNHYLAHLIEYHKTSSGERNTVFDYVEFINYEEIHEEIFSYTQRSLDALGIRWGAAHTEIMLTNNGPRLIESSARMCGGPVVGFARVATGSSQADKLVELYCDGDVKSKDYVFNNTVVPVFLKSPANGILSNVEVLTDLSKLPTFMSQHTWYKNGDLVPKTVDYLTNFGIVALSGKLKDIFEDYKKIRNMESELVIR